MTYSYVYTDTKNNVIKYWEYEDDVKVEKTAPLPLYFYIEKNEESEYKTIFGDNAKRVEFNKFWDFKNKIKKLKEVKCKLYESDIPLETKFIVENYPGQTIKPPKFDIFFIDIEVHSEQGFPLPEDAQHPITIITVWSTKEEKFYIFAEKNFNTDFLETKNINFKKIIIKDEVKLLRYFCKWLRVKHPDILSGWNSQYFDVPYIVNRIKNLLGEKYINKLSPLNKVKQSIKRLSASREVETYYIVGINCIDMMEVFKNYTFSEQESWSLNHIAEQVLGEKKLEHDGSLSELYNSDWQKYVEYNVQDVNLLVRLENEKRFLDLLVLFCYGCRIPFESYEKTTKILDGAILNELFDKNIVLPDVNRDLESRPFPGGYVKDPLRGNHDWVVSFDATSLYPSIMMGWNISPETKQFTIPAYYVPKVLSGLSGEDVVEEDTINIHGEEISITDIIKIIKQNNFCVAGNGSVYSQDSVGILPKIVNDWFQKRNIAKGKMIKAEEEGKKSEEKYWFDQQLNFKILINSIYGYLGTVYSRLYDYDNAMAVTLTGQKITKCTETSLNNYFSGKRWEEHYLFKKSKASTFENFVIYSDTDSCYTDVGRLLSNMHINFESKDNDKICDIINDKICDLISNIIGSAMESFSTKLCNIKDNTIFFKRESIARRAIFVEKKKYVMWEVNGEGNIKKDKLSSKGIEIVRSSTPVLAKKFLKDIVYNILKYMDYNETVKQIQNMRNEFMEAEIDLIAFPRSVNNLTKYNEEYESRGKVFKSTPVHVRGSILHNEILNSHEELRTKYDYIYDGDKIKFVYMKPSLTFKQNILSYKGKWIKEMNLYEFIDRELQFEKSIVSPLEKFFTLLKWNKPSFKNFNIMELFE